MLTIAVGLEQDTLLPCLYIFTDIDPGSTIIDWTCTKFTQALNPHAETVETGLTRTTVVKAKLVFHVFVPKRCPDRDTADAGTLDGTLLVMVPQCKLDNL